MISSYRKGENKKTALIIQGGFWGV